MSHTHTHKVSHLLKKFPTSYRRWNFITVFTNIREVALSRAGLGQSMTHILFFVQMHSYFIVPSEIRSCIWSLSSRSFRQNSRILPPIRAICPAHYILHWVSLTMFGDQHKSPSLCSFLQSPIASPPLGTISSSAPSPSHPQSYLVSGQSKTAATFIISCILIFVFRDKNSALNGLDICCAPGIYS